MVTCLLFICSHNGAHTHATVYVISRCFFAHIP